MPFLSSLFNCSNTDNIQEKYDGVSQANFDLKSKILHDRLDRLYDQVKLLDKHITDVNTSINKIMDKMENKFDMLVMKLEMYNYKKN